MDDINIEEIKTLARRAGEKTLEIYNKDFSVEYKDDQSPLTEADLASHKIIIENLENLYPDIPILSEESKEIPYLQRKDWDVFWLVDPLDGTKEFTKKRGEFTVNIALIKGNKPVLGVVYAPVKDITYYGTSDGSFKEINNRKPLKLFLEQDKSKNAKLRVVASKSHFTPETKEYIENLARDYELVSIGSSLKICLVAEGAADIYPRLGPTMEWDTAAAHAVVKGAGKNIYKFETNEELVYNKQDLRNPWFIVK
ncbi:MAG: 3'(2'),5'-bisphosphate nucleotidase CysQ [Halobacteriota archaeon]